MKKQVFFQFDQKQVESKELVNQFKELWKSQGKRLKDIEDLKLYFNATDQKCYYVVNDDETGSF